MANGKTLNEHLMAETAVTFKALAARLGTKKPLLHKAELKRAAESHLLDATAQRVGAFEDNERLLLAELDHGEGAVAPTSSAWNRRGPLTSRRRLSSRAGIP